MLQGVGGQGMLREALFSLLLGATVALASADLDSSITVPLYGEKVKGFVRVDNVAEDQYVLSFKLDEAPADTRLSLHEASAPFDSGLMVENCRRARKSMHLLRDKKVEDLQVDGSTLNGHTVVLGNNIDVYACATIILGHRPLMFATFHATPIQGPVYILPMQDKVRILPDLKYAPNTPSIGVEFIDWAFVENCEAQNAHQSAMGLELGIDSRASLTIQTSGVKVSLINFQLFRDGKPFACAPIVHVERRSLRAGGLQLTQPHSFVAVSNMGTPQEELHIREDCLDVATETIHTSYHNYFPTVSIFGPDTIMLKSVLVDGGECTTMRPQFGMKSALADFVHPAIGRLVLVDTEDRILLTGNLRSLLDDNANRATVQVSPKFAPSTGCPLYLDDCVDCFTVPDAAIIVGKKQGDVSLIGVLPHFDLLKMRSIVVDLQWAEAPFHVCANLTYLPTGALQATVAAKKYSPVSARTMANIVMLEYPASNYTEVIVSKRGPIDNVEVHGRPVDMTVTSGPPCGDQTIGHKASSAPVWLNRLQRAVKEKDNSTSFVVPGCYVSGANNVLGKSLLFSHAKDFYCGSFRIQEAQKRLVARIDEGGLSGYIVLSQYEGNGEVPLEITYRFDRANSTIDKEEFTWDFVHPGNDSCTGAELYNPYNMNVKDCNSSAPFLCPVGKATERAGALLSGVNQHITANGISLFGSYSASGKVVRLKSKSTNETYCANLGEVNEVSFRWLVLSNRTLSSLQALMCKRLKLSPFQVQIDYNRELHGGRCSAYAVTIIETDDRIADILTLFDVDGMQFREDSDLICIDEPSTTTEKPPTTTTSKASRISTSTLSSSSTSTTKPSKEAIASSSNATTTLPPTTTTSSKETTTGKLSISHYSPFLLIISLLALSYR